MKNTHVPKNAWSAYKICQKGSKADMNERRGQFSSFSEMAYLILLAIGGVYLFVINYVLEPASWRGWFVQRVPPEAAVLNILVLVVLFFSLTLYVRRFPLAVRYLLLITIVCLGSFLRISVDRVPLVALPIILVSMLVYSILWRKRRRKD
jgi:uncharacterized membrane protein